MTTLLWKITEEKFPELNDEKKNSDSYFLCNITYYLN